MEPGQLLRGMVLVSVCMLEEEKSFSYISREAERGGQGIEGGRRLSRAASLERPLSAVRRPAPISPHVMMSSVRPL